MSVQNKLIFTRKHTCTMYTQKNITRDKPIMHPILRNMLKILKVAPMDSRAHLPMFYVALSSK